MRRLLIAVAAALLVGCSYVVEVPPVELQFKGEPPRFPPLIRDGCDYPAKCIAEVAIWRF